MLIISVNNNSSNINNNNNEDVDLLPTAPRQHLQDRRPRMDTRVPAEVVGRVRRKLALVGSYETSSHFLC